MILILDKAQTTQRLPPIIVFFTVDFRIYTMIQVFLFEGRKDENNFSLLDVFITK